MRKTIFSCLLVSAFQLFSFSAFSQLNYGAPQVVVSNLLTYTAVTGTNNGSTYVGGLQVLKIPAYRFYYGQITNAASGSYTTNGITNVVRANIQWSADGVNFTTITNWNPSSTNGGIEVFSPQLFRLTGHFRAQIFTSNAIPVSAEAILPQ